MEAFISGSALPFPGAFHKTSSSARRCTIRAAVKGSRGNPYRIAVLEGDGSGPAVAAAAVKVLQGLQTAAELNFDFVRAPYGAPAFEESGVLVPESTLETCRSADAVLRSYQGMERGVGKDGSAHFQLREGLGLFAQMRPVVVYPQLIAASPLKESVVAGTDLLLVREISAGALGDDALARDKDGLSSTTISYTEKQVRRIAQVACDFAAMRAGKILNVDKADAMAVSRFWRRYVHEACAGRMADDSGMVLQDMYVDDFMREVVLRPKDFDVILTSNLFGDVLAEAIAALAGPQRVTPSCWVNENGLGVYGPADIYNVSAYPSASDSVSPIAAIRSVSMMLRYALDEPAGADLIQQALQKAMMDVATPGTPGNSLPNVDPMEYADVVVRSLEVMRQYESLCNPVECGE